MLSECCCSLTTFGLTTARKVAFGKVRICKIGWIDDIDDDDTGITSRVNDIKRSGKEKTYAIAAWYVNSNCDANMAKTRPPSNVRNHNAMMKMVIGCEGTCICVCVCVCVQVKRVAKIFVTGVPAKKNQHKHKVMLKGICLKQRRTGPNRTGPDRTWWQ